MADVWVADVSGGINGGGISLVAQVGWHKSWWQMSVGGRSLVAEHRVELYLVAVESQPQR